MAVTLRSQSHLGYASHTNPSLTAPAGVLSGDVLFMGAVTFATTSPPAATPTPPAGWTALPGATSGLLVDESNFANNGWDMRLWGFTKVSAGSEPGTYSVTQAAGSSDYWIGAYTGVDNATPAPSGWTGNHATLGSTSTALSVTPTVNGSQIIIVAGDGGDTTNNLSVSGTTPTFTQEISTPVVFDIFDGTLATAAATGNKTWTNNSFAGGSGWVAAMLVLNAAAAAAPTGPVFVTNRIPLGV